MKKIISFAFLICMISFATAQQVTMYPTNWFVGMKLNKVQVLLRSTDPSFSKAKFEVKYPGVTLTKTHSFTNGKYVALDLTIAPTAKVGNVKISATNAGTVIVYDWALLNRTEPNLHKVCEAKMRFIYSCQTALATPIKPMMPLKICAIVLPMQVIYSFVMEEI